MKKLLLLIACAVMFVGCGPSNKERANAIRQTAICSELIDEIESRADVVKTILTDGCGLSVALDFSYNDPEVLAKHFIRMAKDKGIEVEFCKIVSTQDYKWGEWFMTGTQLAFISSTNE